MKFNLEYSDKKEFLNFLRTNSLIIYQNQKGENHFILKSFKTPHHAYEIMKLHMRFNKDFDKAMYVKNGELLMCDTFWLNGNPKYYQSWLDEILKSIK